MQDQGKRLLIAVGLALGVLLVWQVIFPGKKPDPAQTQGSGSAEVPAGPVIPPSAVGVIDHPAVAPTPAPTATDPAPTVVTPAVVEAPRGPEQLTVLKFPTFDATFSNYGGTLVSWRLTDPRYLNDATMGELLPKAAESGAFSVNFANSTYVLPLKAEWKLVEQTPASVHYALETPQLVVDKTFELIPNSYLVRLTVKVTDKIEGEAHETLAVTTYGAQNPAETGGGSSRIAARVWQSSTLRDGAIVATDVGEVLKFPRFETNVQWTGFEHPYLLVAMAPHPFLGGVFQKHTAGVNTAGLMRTELWFPPAMLKGHDSVTREIIGYLGPKNYDDLEHADDVAGFSTGFKSTIDLGWFAFIGRPLLWLLQKFHEVVGNWGIAIILLTFLVKALTLFWTTKSMRSMKAMSALAPQMKALQEKYKDDKQRQQAETMALYKQHNVNPLAGCLPILLQMPIWLALYRMLSSAGELYQQPFVPGWINDLTMADPVYVLPVILVVTMFVQARLQPATGDSRQQKLMQYGMPLMFGVMSFFFPAGLTLYIFTNTVLSALHSIYMNKYDKKSLAIAAAIKKNAAAAADKAKVIDVKGKKSEAKPEPKRSVKAEVKDALGDAADDDDDADGADAEEGAAGTAGASPAARQRPRRKKRRR